MAREWASEEQREEIDDALRAPNRWNAARQAPEWFGSDEDVWAEFEATMRAT